MLSQKSVFARDIQYIQYIVVFIAIDGVCFSNNLHKDSQKIVHECTLNCTLLLFTVFFCCVLVNSIQLLNYRLAFIVKQPQEKTEGSLQQQHVGKRLQRRVGQ